MIIKRIKDGEYKYPHLFFEQETLRIGKLTLEIFEGSIPIEWDWQCKFGDFEPTYCWYINGPAKFAVEVNDDVTITIEFDPNEINFTKYLDDNTVCEAIKEYERELA